MSTFEQLKSGLDDWSWQWDPDEPDVPLMLYESQARRNGISDTDIENAKTVALPCPQEWGVPQKTWTLITPIPTHVSTWQGVTFVETKKRKR